ncbi:MAG: hypothetical protein C0481_07480 [Phenylobacterium sp.]|nr:hypothetical protein [Phenylobacterium sp.]
MAKSIARGILMDTSSVLGGSAFSTVLYLSMSAIGSDPQAFTMQTTLAVAITAVALALKEMGSRYAETPQGGLAVSAALC